jgi:diaminopimelate epimerase
MEAVGNDFVLLRESDTPHDRWPEIARRLCERRFGVGSDGLLVLGGSEVADFRMRMFNPDGTEDHCGNGMRCAAILQAGELRPGEEKFLAMETYAGIRKARVFRQGDRTLAEIGMGEPMFHPKLLPMDVAGDRVIDYPLEADGVTLPATVVSTGSLHAVIFLPEDRKAELFDRLSPKLEHHPLFPERASIMWATVPDPTVIRLRIWERGAGETLGCGTGACAAMVAARLHGLVGDRSAIQSPGGELQAFWAGEGEVVLTGEARRVFDGCWTAPLSGKI